MSAPNAETETFQHFRILRRDDGTLWKLGEGGMGATYKAVDSNLGVAVALKLIRADLLNRDPGARSRFSREAKAAASLRHRHVATVYHLGDDGRNYFYAMEFVDGETLEERVKRLGPLPVEKTLALALQASRALIAAHKVGLVHRDLKPANLMLVDEADEDDVLKLIDFGLAKSAAASGGSGLGGGADYKITQTGFSAGFSPGCASPEQCQYLDADIRSDIYSLGVTLWFVLTGELPFAPTVDKPLEAQVFELQSKHVHAPPPLEKLETAGVPAPVRELLGRMLEKDPARRPQTPADLRGEIEACQRLLSGSAPPPPPYSFSLEELLRERGQLSWLEVTPLLARLAAIADELAASGPEALARFAPCYLHAVFPSCQLSAADHQRPSHDLQWPAEWPARWPDFRLIAHLFSPDTSRSSETGMPNITRPAARQGFRDAAQALAALLYKLLAGQQAPVALGSGATAYTPLPALNAAGNDALRRALGGADHSFASAREFGAALAVAAGSRGGGSRPPSQPTPLPPMEEPRFHQRQTKNPHDRSSRSCCSFCCCSQPAALPPGRLGIDSPRRHRRLFRPRPRHSQRSCLRLCPRSHCRLPACRRPCPSQPWSRRRDRRQHRSCRRASALARRLASGWWWRSHRACEWPCVGARRAASPWAARRESKGETTMRSRIALL